MLSPLYGLLVDLLKQVKKLGNASLFYNLIVHPCANIIN